jgi:hypothetical protein
VTVPLRTAPGVASRRREGRAAARDWMVALVALGWLTSLATPARAIDEAELARLQSELAQARYVRVGMEGRILRLERPRAQPGGLDYDRALLPPRSAIVVDPGESVAPPRPIPWSSIRTIESGSMDRGSAALRGACVLGAIGAVAGYVVFWLASSEGGADPTAGAVLGGTTGVLGGAVLGVLTVTPHWRTIYTNHGSESAKPRTP